MMEYEDQQVTIVVFFPNIRKKKLVLDARLHAIGQGNYEISDERAVVHHLRHNFTDYDEDQSQVRHREACEAIAVRYPWLAEECRRQINRRAVQEAMDVEISKSFEAERARYQVERRAVVDASRQAITGMSVGQKVYYTYKRWTYEAEIIKLGRSKVTVSYVFKSGEERVKTVHAALVTPIE